MKISIAGTTLFDVVKAVKSIVTEVRFEADEKGLELTCMDPANVAMVILKMPSSSCIEWDVDDKEYFGINLLNLATILKRGAKEDDITTLETKDNKVEIKINHGRKFTIPMIEIESKEVKIPELAFKATVEANLKDLQMAVDDVEIVTDSAFFEVTKDKKFIISGEGDLMKAKVEVEGVSVKAESKARSKFAVDYLQNMVKATKAEKVTIELSPDYPLRMSLNMKTFTVKFILAPRVDNDDEPQKDEEPVKAPAKPAIKEEIKSKSSIKPAPVQNNPKPKDESVKEVVEEDDEDEIEAED